MVPFQKNCFTKRWLRKHFRQTRIFPPSLIVFFQIGIYHILLICVQIPVSIQKTGDLNASIPPFTDVHGPCLQEGTSKHEDLFEKLTVYVSVLCT